MKRLIALLFVALLLVMVAPAGFGVNTQPVNISSHSSVWADGGTPVPPFPKGSSVMWADGGAPIPKFPNGSLWADGGAP
ncbi:MAG: hypothetical protein ACRD37_05115, partial [Candidatus Acidiferrales bacterium]